MSVTIYISGAITGIPNCNKNAFQSAQRAIAELKRIPRLRGMKIINPLHLGARLEKTFAVRGKGTPIWVIICEPV